MKCTLKVWHWALASTCLSQNLPTQLSKRSRPYVVYMHALSLNSPAATQPLVSSCHMHATNTTTSSHRRGEISTEMSSFEVAIATAIYQAVRTVDIALKISFRNRPAPTC